MLLLLLRKCYIITAGSFSISPLISSSLEAGLANQSFSHPACLFSFSHSSMSYIHFSPVQHSTSIHTVSRPAVRLSCTPAPLCRPVLCSCSSSALSVFPSVSFPLSETGVSKATIPLSSSPAEGAPSPLHSTAQNITITQRRASSSAFDLCFCHTVMSRRLLDVVMLYVINVTELPSRKYKEGGIGGERGERVRQMRQMR